MVIGRDYPDNFLDAIGILGKPFMASGGSLIGKVSRDDYELKSVALKVINC